MTVDDLAELDLRHVTIIDVRTSEEFSEGHIPGSQLVPLPVLIAQDTQLSSTGTVYVVCGSGVRSTRAVETLRAHGIDAVVVAGGVLAWTASGRPTSRGHVR